MSKANCNCPWCLFVLVIKAELPLRTLFSTRLFDQVQIRSLRYSPVCQWPLLKAIILFSFLHSFEGLLILTFHKSFPIWHLAPWTEERMNRVDEEPSKAIFLDGIVFLQQLLICPRKLSMPTTKSPSLSSPWSTSASSWTVSVQQFMWLNSKGTNGIPVIFMFCGGIFSFSCAYQAKLTTSV